MVEIKVIEKLPKEKYINGKRVYRKIWSANGYDVETYKKENKNRSWNVILKFQTKTRDGDGYEWYEYFSKYCVTEKQADDFLNYIGKLNKEIIKLGELNQIKWLDSHGFQHKKVNGIYNEYDLYSEDEDVVKVVNIIRNGTWNNVISIEICNNSPENHTIYMDEYFELEKLKEKR